MTELPFMQWCPADYLADTDHLSLEEHGAYRLLLDRLWMAGGSIPFDSKRIARRMRISTRKFKALWGEIGDFFCLEDGQISHRRVTADLKKARELVEKRKKAGKKSARERWKKANENSGAALANAQQTDNKPEPQVLVTPQGGNKELEIDKKTGITETEDQDAAPSATARESGGGLVAASGRRLTLRERLGENGYGVWRDLRDDLTRGHRLSNSDVDQVARVLVGFDGSAFTITEQPYDGHRWQAVQEIASVEGLSITERKSPSLRVVAGATQNSGE